MVERSRVKISIIVPAFNEQKLIVQTLQSIRAASEVFTELGWESELVVCDNNSTDRTADLSRGAGAKVVFEPVNQIARARNTGAAGATGDWLIFVDADSRPAPGLFSSVAQAIQSGRYLAGGSTVRLDGRYPLASFMTEGWNLLSRFNKWAAGSFIFCETTAFREIGGFSHELYASEEIDLSKRLKALARQRGKDLIILRDHPLVTSARKLHLYGARDVVRFLGRNIWLRGRAVNSREECAFWYDGRR